MQKSCRTSPSVHEGASASSTGKSKGAVNSLKPATSGLTPAKRESSVRLIK